MTLDFLPSWTLDIVRLGFVGIVSSLFTSWIAQRSHRLEKRHDALEQQLRDFYAPLIALRDDIRVRLSYCDDPRFPSGWDQDYFINAVWPLYDKIVALFASHGWLAERSTRDLFPAVRSLIESSDRALTYNLCSAEDVANALERDDRMNRFDDHLRTTLDELHERFMGDDKARLAHRWRRWRQKSRASISSRSETKTT